MGMFWQDEPVSRKRGERQLGPMPEIPYTGWTPPREFPNLSAAKVIGYDTETWDPELLTSGPGWGRGPGKGHIVGVSVAVHGGAWYFPMRHETQPEMNLDPAQVLRWLQHVLGDNRPKVGANLVYDLGWLRQEGVRVGGRQYDVQFAEALLNSETPDVSLEALSQKYLGFGKQTELLYEWLAAWFGGTPTDKQRKWIAKSPPSLAGPYAEGDAVQPLQIIERQWTAMQQRGVLDVFDMECRLIPLLVDMRFKGAPVSMDRAQHIYDTLGGQAKEVEQRLIHLCGPINPNAPESVGKALKAAGVDIPLTFDKKKQVHKLSVAAPVLETIDHPIAEMVLEYRRLTKVANTFVKSYIMNKQVNGRLHCSFNPLKSDSGGTRSGRFSSSDPNLQNIPVRTAEGKLVRKAFVAAAVHSLTPKRKQWYLDRGLMVPQREGRWRKWDYCVAPETLITTADYGQLRADQVKVGQEVVAFEEQPRMVDGRAQPRRYEKARVTGVRHLRQPRVRLTFEDGTTTVCSSSHRWLACEGPNKTRRFVEAAKLAPGWRIPTLHDKHLATGNTYQHGWLAGMFDGEGHMFDGTMLTIAQKPGPVLDRLVEYLEADGFSLAIRTDATAHTIRLRGGRRETLRALALYRPIRMINTFTGVFGTTIGSKVEPPKVITQVEPLEEGPVIAIETTSKTFIADGLCSHNSQIEYRMLMHHAVGPMADEVRLIFNQDFMVDYHNIVLELIAGPAGWDISSPELYDKWRRPTKTINFGLIYGMSKKELIKRLKLTVAEGNRVFEAYHGAAPFIRKTMEEASNEARAFGNVQTILGRRSDFMLYGPAQYDPGAQGLPYEQAIMKYGAVELAYTHKALNRKLQGGAADVMKKAMVDCYEAGVFAEDACGIPILTVHDELDFEDMNAPDNPAWEEMRQIMQNCVKLKVPVRIDESVGPSWGEAD